MTTLTLKLPKTLDDRLAAVAKLRRESKTAIVCQAVENYLTQQQTGLADSPVNTQSAQPELTREYFEKYLKEHGEPAPESFAAQAQKYIGCLDDDVPADLSTNKKHFEGFGE